MHWQCRHSAKLTSNMPCLSLEIGCRGWRRKLKEFTLDLLLRRVKGRSTRSSPLVRTSLSSICDWLCLKVDSESLLCKNKETLHMLKLPFLLLSTLRYDWVLITASDLTFDRQGINGPPSVYSKLSSWRMLFVISLEAWRSLEDDKLQVAEPIY